MHIYYLSCYWSIFKYPEDFVKILQKKDKLFMLKHIAFKSKWCKVVKNTMSNPFAAKSLLLNTEADSLLKREKC